MTTYTFSEARQKLSSVLEKARTQGEVLIKRKDGSIFAVKPMSSKRSPLDVAGINVDKLVINPEKQFFVIPVKTGIQSFQVITCFLDTRFRGYDDFLRMYQC